MTAKQIIDLMINDYLNPGSSDANSAAIRRRVWECLQEAVEEVWDAADWDFKGATNTIAAAADVSEVDCPSDFSTFGENGGLYWSGDRQKLRYVDPNTLYSMREYNSVSGRPEAYTVIQQTTSTFLPQIQFDRTNDQSRTLRAYYDSIPPLVLDGPLAPTAADSGSAGNLNGAYTWRITFVGTDSTESEGGTISSSLSVTNKSVSLTNIMTGTGAVTSRKVYRTVASGTQHKLVATISDNTTTTYTDNTADGSLGDNVPTTSSVQRIPQEYHRSVLYKRALVYLAKTQGDIRSATEFKAAADEALRRMKARRRQGLEDLMRLGDMGLPTWEMH